MNASNAVLFRPYQLAALLILLMTAFTAPLTIAFNIGAIISKFGSSQAAAGLVLTAEGAAISLASFACSRLATKYYLRSLLVFGLVFAAVGNALTVFSSDTQEMILYRVIAGIGIGTVISAVMVTAARTPKPEMTFGWVNGCAGAFLAVLGLVIPKVILAGGLEGAYSFYAGLAAFGLVLVFVVPNGKAPEEEKASGSKDRKSGLLRGLKDNMGWIALFGLGVFFVGQGGIAAFIARIGGNMDIPLETIGTIFFVAGLLTIVCPIAAGMIGARFGSTKPLVIVGILFCLSVLGIAVSGNSTIFSISVPLLIVLPAILLPSFLGGLVVVDPTGRLAGAHPAFVTMGGALGPVIAGSIADVGGFAMLGWYVVSVLICGLLLMAAGTLKADWLRKADLQPAE